MCILLVLSHFIWFDIFDETFLVIFDCQQSGIPNKCQILAFCFKNRKNFLSLSNMSFMKLKLV